MFTLLDPGSRKAGLSRGRGKNTAGRLRFIGSGLRLATSAHTKAGNNYVAGDMAMGMPSWPVDELYFFFPTFYCTNSDEVDCPNGYTIEGIATRVEGGLRTLGLIDDGSDPVVIDPGESATQYGKWVKFTPASPIPANATQIFSFAQYIPDGAYPRGRGGTIPASTIFGGTTKDERSQGSGSSLLSTLSGSANYSNVNGNIVFPAACIARAPGGRLSAFVIGTSICYGAHQTNAPELLTERHEFGFMGMGLDDNLTSERIPFNNWAVPGWGHSSTSTTGSHGNETACARQLWAMAQARAINDGLPLCDMIWSEHGTNFSGTQAQYLTSYRELFRIWREAVGDDDTPCYQAEMLPYPQSTDGYATLGNQTPLAAADYPSGVRWAVNADIGGADGLGDASATLRADGTIQGSFAPWRVSSADTSTQRDLLSVRAFNTTLASNYTGSGDVVLTDEPTPGDYLSLYDGTNTAGFVVLAVTGTGPYTVTPQFRTGGTNSFSTANTAVRSMWHDTVGLHPGPLAHIAYADDAVIPFKVALGYEAPLVAPAFSSSSITGTPTNGQTLTVNVVVTGNPTPSLAYQWQKNGVDISGETGSTIDLDESSMGLAVDDDISCEVTATNSQGSATEEPSVTYIDPTAGSLLVGATPGYFVDPSNVPAATSRITFRGKFTWPSITAGMKPFTQESNGCDLQVETDGRLRLTVEDGTGTTRMSAVQMAAAGSITTGVEHDIVLDVNQATNQATLTLNGTPNTVAFTTTGNGVFQSNREVSFLGTTAGGNTMPNGTEVRDLSVDFNGALHKEIPNSAAAANADAWKQGGDFTAA